MRNLDFALNQKTAAGLGYEAFLDLAADIGCVGVEARDDLGRPLFDGLEPAAAGELARSKGLRLLGLSQVYPFDDWTNERRDAARKLLDNAKASGAESISLIPRVDGIGPAGRERDEHHSAILGEIAGWPTGDVAVLVEPIGFERCSIRRQADAVHVLESLGNPKPLRIIHDTFQHRLACDADFLVDHIRMVHISGAAVPEGGLTDADDAKRVLVDAADETGAVEQIGTLLDRGYRGAFSFEVTSPGVAASPDLAAALRASMRYIRDRLNEPR